MPSPIWMMPLGLKALMPDSFLAIHFFRHNNLLGPEITARAYALISPEERKRFEGMRHEGRARDFLLARLLVRLALSHHCPHITPEKWNFAVNPFGKPELLPPTCLSSSKETNFVKSIAWPLFCNWSHTDGLVACVISDVDAVGVDVEVLPGTLRDWARVADRFFTASEQAYLAQTDWPHAECVKWWTAKEAVIKALGSGMLHDAASFSLLPLPENEWRCDNHDSLPFHTTCASLTQTPDTGDEHLFSYDNIHIRSWNVTDAWVGTVAMLTSTEHMREITFHDWTGQLLK